jgi:hypothetical protein
MESHIKEIVGRRSVDEGFPLSACNEMGAGKNPADDSNVFGH